MSNCYLNGMMGLVVGDALGNPVQFMLRQDIKNRVGGPVTGMEAGGVYHTPIGAWTDDSSMAIATLASIKDCKAVNLDDIMMRFIDWLDNGEYTPEERAFDMGMTCSAAINYYKNSGDAYNCGMTGEYANGNGALMRILPVCLYLLDLKAQNKITLDDSIDTIHKVAALTHNHVRSNMCCGIYYFMCDSILAGQDKGLDLKTLLQEGINKALTYYGLYEDPNVLEQMSYAKRLFYLDKFKELEEDDIKSSGYVIDTIEAAVWSLITTDSYKDCMLKTVNLGDDADTVAAVAGGLAGLYYGYNGIPKEWLGVIIKRDKIEEICKGMINS